MADTDNFVPGDHNAVCFECGRKRKASELKRHWQGYYVCPEHWEPRHPQDFVRGVKENPAAPFIQQSRDTFIEEGEGIITETSNEITGDFIFIVTEDNQIIYTEN